MCSIVLDVRSIVDTLSCLQVGITAEDIVNPKADRVQLIYHAFCTQILDVSETALSQLPYEHINNLDNPEMHQKSIPLLLLFTTMRCFIADFGDDSYDFTMCDLINPQPKRTRKLISVIADFTEFYKCYRNTTALMLRYLRNSEREKASQVFEKTSAEYNEARRAVEMGQEEVRLAEERKNALRNELNIRRRKENELLAELNSKKAILRELCEEGKTNENRRDALLKSIQNGKQAIVDLKNEAKSLNSEIEHLSKGIVKSPARVVRDVEAQRALIKSLQERCNSERQRIHDNEESIKVIEQISKMLDELSKEFDRLRDLQNEVNFLEQDFAKSKALHDDVVKQKLRTEEVLSRLTISGEEEAKNHERTYELYNSRLQDLRSRKETLSSVVGDLRANASSSRHVEMELKKEIVRLRNEKIRETETARTNCLELLRRFNDLLEKYHRAEEQSELESKSFADVLHSISSALDDAERTIDDDVV